MLLTNNFMKSIEEQLNSGQSEVIFKFFADVGNFKDAYRKGNDTVQYVQGIFSLAPSQLTPIKNLNIAVITARLELEVDIDTLPAIYTESGDLVEYPLVRLVRDIWDSFAEANNGRPINLVDDNGKSYSVTPSYSLLSDGVVDMSTSNTGEVMILATTMSFTVVENGINTNDINIYINGENIMFGQATMTRVRVADGMQFTDYADNYDSVNQNKTVIQQNGFGIDLNIPLLNSSVGQEIMDDIMGGGNNKAYAVLVSMDNSSNGYSNYGRAYLMTTGTNTIGFVPAENLSARVNLVEVAPIVAKFDSDRWKKQSVNNSAVVFLGGLFIKGTIIIWGDGYGEIITSNVSDLTYNYAEAGNYTVYIYEPYVESE